MLTITSAMVLSLNIPKAAPVLPLLVAIEITFGIRLKYSTSNKKCLVTRSITKTPIIEQTIVIHFFILSKLVPHFVSTTFDNNILILTRVVLYIYLLYYTYKDKRQFKVQINYIDANYKYFIKQTILICM